VSGFEESSGNRADRGLSTGGWGVQGEQQDLGEWKTNNNKTPEAANTPCRGEMKKRDSRYYKRRERGRESWRGLPYTEIKSSRDRRRRLWVYRFWLAVVVAPRR
jgi:hypothetical protein